MKKILFFCVLLWLSACSPFDIPDNANPGISMDDLVFPENFDYETTDSKTVRLTAKTAAGENLKEVPFSIFLLDEGQPKKLFEHYIEDEEFVEIELNLPSDADSLLVKTDYAGLPPERVVAIGTGIIEINLGEENRPAFGDSEDQSLLSSPSENASSRNSSLDFRSNPPPSGAYTPAQGAYGSLAFEDLFPYQGDYDFNDIVVDYNFQEILSSNTTVSGIVAKFKLRAMGGNLHNGFGFQLNVAPGLVGSVSGYLLTGGVVSLLPSGVEAGQNKAVVIVFDDGLTLMPGGASGFVNTKKSKPYEQPVEFTINITFTQAISRSLLGAPPYNAFTFVGGLRGKEVHLAGFPPTSLANPVFFGLGQDTTDPATGRFYKTSNNLPYAVNTPVPFEYPVEHSAIINSYLKFFKWAEGHGKSFSNWYKDNPGFRNPAAVY